MSGGSHRAPRARRAAAVAATTLGGLLLAAAPASAHLVTTGLGPFYDGVGHLALTPEDLLAAAALALCAGLRGRDHSRAALVALPGAWLAGGWAGLLLQPQAVQAAVLSLLVLGALVALDLSWPRRLTALLAAAVGALHGFLDGGAMAATAGGSLAVAGVVAAVAVIATLICALVVSLRAPWTRIAVRVAGSWIAAIGLLMLGWWIGGGL